MKDRFRFRAWDKRQKFMEQCEGISLNDIFQNEDVFISMQCTGLKDKNDKLVYFGDIIEDNIGHRFVVTQDLNVESLNYGSVILHKIPIIQDYIEYTPTLISKSKVIGNIYENPELLEVRK